MENLSYTYNPKFYHNGGTKQAVIIKITWDFKPDKIKPRILTDMFDSERVWYKSLDGEMSGNCLLFENGVIHITNQGNKPMDITKALAVATSFYNDFQKKFSECVAEVQRIQKLLGYVQIKDIEDLSNAFVSLDKSLYEHKEDTHQKYTELWTELDKKQNKRTK